MTLLKKILPVILFLIFLSSCYNLYDNYTDELGPLEPNEFYARNFRTGKLYKVKANRFEQGGKFCDIWVENGSATPIMENAAKAIAEEYDTIIRPKIINAFSQKNIVHRGFSFSDMLEFANWLAGKNDNKLTILLLDIQDDYYPPSKKLSYIAGYFFQADFLQKGWVKGTKSYSNGRDIIYIDISPGLNPDNLKKTYATLAHELQHLINFVTSVFLEDREKTMDLWIDEGLSSQAEYIYLGENPKEKINHFNESETIKKGNNFFIWDNHKEEMAIHDEYATVYLFFR